MLVLALFLAALQPAGSAVPDMVAVAGPEAETEAVLEVEVESEIVTGVEVDDKFAAKGQETGWDIRRTLGKPGDYIQAAEAAVVGPAVVVEQHHDRDPCILVDLRGYCNLQSAQLTTSNKGESAVPRPSSNHFEGLLQRPHVPVMKLHEDQDLAEFAAEGPVICWPLPVELLFQRFLYIVVAEALTAR